LTRWPSGISPATTHFLAYTLLGGLTALALRERSNGMWLALGISAVLGMGIETLQLAVPVRTFSFFDLGMNVLGSLAGVTLVWLFDALLVRSGR
jgi:glycopeptide antibiotics resistance protein